MVGPKELEVKQAEAQLKEAEEELAEKKSKLQEVLDLLNVLQEEFDTARKEKEDLEAKVVKCQTHKNRADQLI